MSLENGDGAEPEGLICDIMCGVECAAACIADGPGPTDVAASAVFAYLND